MLLLFSYLRKSLPTWFHLLRVQNEFLLEHGASKGQKKISCVQVPMGFFTPCRRQSLWLAQNLAIFLLNLLFFVSLLSSSNWHLSQRRWHQHITLSWYHRLCSPISRFWDRVLGGGFLLRSTPRIASAREGAEAGVHRGRSWALELEWPFREALCWATMAWPSHPTSISSCRAPRVRNPGNFQTHCQLKAFCGKHPQQLGPQVVRWRNVRPTWIFQMERCLSKHTLQSPHYIDPVAKDRK